MLTKKMCTACKDKAPIIKSPRCKSNGMHVLDITNLRPNVNVKHHTAMTNSSLTQRQSKVANVQNCLSFERLIFFHSTLGGKPLRTIKELSLQGI